MSKEWVEILQKLAEGQKIQRRIAIARFGDTIGSVGYSLNGTPIDGVWIDSLHTAGLIEQSPLIASTAIYSITHRGLCYLHLNPDEQTEFDLLFSQFQKELKRIDDDRDRRHNECVNEYQQHKLPRLLEIGDQRKRQHDSFLPISHEETP